MDNINDLISEDKFKITDIKSKAGRPKKSTAERRTHKVMIYLNEHEKNLLTQKAQKLDLTIADFARRAVITYCNDMK